MDFFIKGNQVGCLPSISIKKSSKDQNLTFLIKEKIDNDPNHKKRADLKLMYEHEDNQIGITFNCNQCGYKALWKSSLDKHIKSSHEEVCYNCDQCGYKATTKFCLNRHIKSKHEGNHYNCNQCEYKATLKSDLSQHNKSQHKGVQYDCFQCEYKSKRRDNLTIHIESQHEGIRYNCDQQARRKGGIRPPFLGLENICSSFILQEIDCT